MKTPSLATNMVYSLLSKVQLAASQFGVIAIVARLGSPEVVGALTLASAVVTPLFFFASMGMRRAHTVDDLTTYSRADYIALRLMSGAGAAVLALAAVIAF